MRSQRAIADDADRDALDNERRAVQIDFDDFEIRIFGYGLHDEVTVKRLRRRGNHVQLVPENPDFKIIEVDNRTPLTIEGIAVGVIRNGTL